MTTKKRDRVLHYAWVAYPTTSTAEVPRVSPSRTLSLAERTGQTFPHPGQALRRWAGPVEPGHDPGTTLRPVQRRPAPGLPPGPAGELRRPTRRPTHRLRGCRLLRAVAGLGPQLVARQPPGPGPGPHQPRRPLPCPVRQRRPPRPGHPRGLEGAAGQRQRGLEPALVRPAHAAAPGTGAGLGGSGPDRPRPGVVGVVPPPRRLRLAPPDAPEGGRHVPPGWLAQVPQLQEVRPTDRGAVRRGGYGLPAAGGAAGRGAAGGVGGGVRTPLAGVYRPAPGGLLR